MTAAAGLRGATFSHLNSMTDGAGKLMVDVFITAGPHWYGGETNHIEVIGWNTKRIGELVEVFDNMSDEEWLCAYTLAADDWQGTPEDLINAAKELA